MPTELTSEEKISQLKSNIEDLTKQLELMKAQIELESTRQTQEALLTKTRLDALTNQATSQSALAIAQAQLPFAELQGIKAGTAGLTLPTGKEGTIKVSAGVAETALLRSKQPLLTLLDEIADELVKACPEGDVVLLTEAQLGQAYTAQFTCQRITEATESLVAVTEAANPKKPASPGLLGDHLLAVFALGGGLLPPIVAGAYGLGFTLDTINSLAKLFRANLQLDVFNADAEGLQLLGYLLEAKTKRFSAHPAMLGAEAIAAAAALLQQLKGLGGRLQIANDTLAKIKKYADDIAKAAADDPLKQIQMPSDEQVSLLKAEIDTATALLDGLNPAKKPEAFWAQVSGQCLAEKIQGKHRLLIELKAQSVQATKSNWHNGDRFFAIGEVRVAYRLLDQNGSLIKSCVSLKASPAYDTKVDDLTALKWPEVYIEP